MRRVHDVRSLRTLDVDEPDPRHRKSLLKPIVFSARGVAYVGGDAWPSRSAPGCVCLRAFVVGSSDTDAPRAECAAALGAAPRPGVPFFTHEKGHGRVARGLRETLRGPAARGRQRDW